MGRGVMRTGLDPADARKGAATVLVVSRTQIVVPVAEMFAELDELKGQTA